MTPTNEQYTEYNAIAEQLEQLRLRSAQSVEKLPQAYVQAAGMLSYHLRQAYKEARLLAAGSTSEEVKQQGA
jgi:hypothetical protein